MRRVVLVSFVFAGVAGCYGGPQSAPPQGYPQQQWGGPQGGGEYFCYGMASQTTRGSTCFAAYERCEDERRRAQEDGLGTNACQPQSPVSCFQLGGDPAPERELCAASVEDCDLLRLIDRDKNGRTGDVCEWRHGPGLPR